MEAHADSDSAAVVINETATIRWGAVIAGAFAAIATWGLLMVLGLAIGLSAVDTTDTGSLKASGLFTGIWGVISPLVALFVGGIVAGSGAGIVNRAGGALHGFIMWSLATIAGAWLLVSVVAAIVSGVASVGKTALQAGGTAVAAGAKNSGGLANVAQKFGLDANAAVAPINQRLQAQGKPPITPDQLQAATKDVVQNGVRTGSIDRNQLIQSLQQNTALSQADAQQVADQVSNQYQQFKTSTEQRASAAAQKVQAGAMKAAEASGKAMWGVFAALVLGLISAILGGLVGVGRSQRATVARAERVTQRPLQPREV